MHYLRRDLEQNLENAQKALDEAVKSSKEIVSRIEKINKCEETHFVTEKISQCDISKKENSTMIRL